MPVLIVTGTGTGVGKTIVAAALATVASARGDTVAYLKVAQTGVPDEEADVDVVRRLARHVDVAEGARFAAALSPEAAARDAGLPPVDLAVVTARAGGLAATHDLVLIEGAGGVLVRYDGAGSTLAELARALDAPLLVVAHPGLGTLNATALTIEAINRRSLRLDGLVLGAWPLEPDLAAYSNLLDLPVLTGQPLTGALPAGASRLGATAFLNAATTGLAQRYGGTFDPRQLADPHHGTQQCAQIEPADPNQGDQ